ncbi:protein S40-1-like [Vicia villosa]|uniref:protein S40-1-like n=1 Tax=Vicia villosa TaxID=3911 RepID=UPI00273B6CF9|nr:protein S40-1-like [Vicia villosa]
MAEEFFESDVVFSDQIQSEEEQENETLKKQQHQEEEEENSGDKINQAEKNKTAVSSKPMRIPEEMFCRWGNGYEFEDEEEMVPPHVIMARRLAGKMTFSMCFGNGRTLKGRDLSRVRNSILRMTGFIEV